MFQHLHRKRVHAVHLVVTRLSFPKKRKTRPHKVPHPETSNRLAVAGVSLGRTRKVKRVICGCWRLPINRSHKMLCTHADYKVTLTKMQPSKLRWNVLYKKEQQLCHSLPDELHLAECLVKSFYSVNGGSGAYFVCRYSPETCKSWKAALLSVRRARRQGLYDDYCVPHSSSKQWWWPLCYYFIPFPC